MQEIIIQIATTATTVLVPLVGFFISMLRRMERLSADMSELKKIMELEQYYLKDMVQKLDGRIQAMEAFREEFYRSGLIQALEKNKGQ